MSRAETYPWRLMTEVGDYFLVPYSFKPYNYMSLLVSQRNYKDVDHKKYHAAKTKHGTIVMVCEVEDEVPAHEFTSPEGIMSSSSRRFVQKLQREDPEIEIGDIKLPQRSLKVRVNSLAHAEKLANLPWWYDEKTGNLLWNSKVASVEDTEKYMNGWRPGPMHEYPESYRLDFALNKIPSENSQDDEEIEDFGDHPIFGDQK